ncbi:SDR family NAD(P)-dependent oxidoreductase [Pseudonocardia sp. DSM 110487]|uniref:SDR family NAD(P)-dependent oxidoreductase n=1 Tax=Pseudonocardia sp. DSM 110487 TaxID=2865833 RepID=UPI001C69699C|nr:SDR family NAD(P)-dependent oxidoreductase [Pseudonocardia sp. DSM 110487]QYN36324.1 SDR family NAD(P)-dependent oxidoreductase [Pseudonocardia sp. DSM 110487]
MNAAIVTGAAGALGHAVAAEFRAAGRPVVALDRPGERLEKLGAEDGVHAIPVDLADRAAVHAAFAEVDALPVTPDALVALAGGFVPGNLAEVDEEQLDGLWRSNFGSTLWTAQAAAPRLAARGGGAIVTVGSRTAMAGAAPVAHATSKAAVVRLTALLAEELRADRIRVNAVLPSTIDTPANRTWMSPKQAERAVAPEAIAKVIAFLCGPDAAPISGAAIPVYGDA